MPPKETNNPEPETEEQVSTQTKEESTDTQLGTEEGTGKETGKQPQKEDLQKKAAEEGELQFTEKIDPTKLPKELQSIYKSMQSDYTKKMQEMKSIETNFSEAQQAKDALEKLWADPEFQKWRVAETERRRLAIEMQQKPDFDSMTEEQKIQWHVKRAVAETERRLEDKFARTYGVFMNSKMAEEAQIKIDNFKKEHPEATDDDLASLATTIREHGVDLNQAYILKFPERFTALAVKKAREELELKKRANLEIGGIGEGSPQIIEKPTFEQALEISKKELGLK